MKRNFWRGMITGSILGALMSMVREPQKKLGVMPSMRNKLRRKYSQSTTDRMIRGVTRRVTGIIGKK